MTSCTEYGSDSLQQRCTQVQFPPATRRVQWATVKYLSTVALEVSEAAKGQHHRSGKRGIAKPVSPTRSQSPSSCRGCPPTIGSPEDNTAPKLNLWKIKGFK
ncbi:huntingtin-interacting protein 1-related protein [Platysternon megacephalum]|uniref:Huntingtin-interacting protein 1-related protein n=1 Tax=Platysternon megacephalum TaxID=55544 RepID=A0A4D9F8J3_9SAUR|nr:huntingtin-interacting protein 1-related protein [Platysternon megacephalum]